MFQRIKVQLNERVVIFRDGLPVRALGPGRHILWGRKHSEQRFQTDELEFRALPEVRDLLPESWFSEVALNSRQRAVLVKDGVPKVFLRPGVHRYWTLDPSVKLVVLSVDDALPELTDELVAILPRKEYVVAMVQEHQRGLEYVQGRLVRVLEPGYHAYWTHPEARVTVDVVDMRQEQLTIAGQELMTRDKVTLRLSMSVEFAVEDPIKAVQLASELRDSVYLMVQLAARDYVAGVRLDELLEGRDQMSQFLLEQASRGAAPLGVRVERVGVKDIVLPGEMRVLLNRVIEAEKEAAANVILRREETAATRSLANTARVMADHPILLRLKELEAMKDIAERIDKLRIVVGTESLSKILPESLLGNPSNSAGS
jgi:regulator of protease activity HflC (stomatin/prohibitin superfamily)